MHATRFLEYAFSPSTHAVEAGRLRFFAKATGCDDPVFRDAHAAREAGYPALPVPPTFAFCLELDRDEPLAFLDDLGVDLARVLHAEQAFTYHAPIFAGDVITFESRISDVYDKKGGALTFIVIERIGRKEDETPAVTMHSTLVVRND